MVGTYEDATGGHGFLYSGGVFTTIDDPNGSFNFAAGINDAGQIVGSCSNATGRHGCLDSNGVFTTIDDPDGLDTVVANGINASGQIVGEFVLTGCLIGLTALRAFRARSARPKYPPITRHNARFTACRTGSSNPSKRE
jgi:hypothetical protein